jgi:hypothetical protein
MRNASSRLSTLWVVKRIQSTGLTPTGGSSRGGGALGTGSLPPFVDGLDQLDRSIPGHGLQLKIE